MNCVICAIAKRENIYINEWCKYHLNLGFKHIYLYDNNDTDYPFVGNFISKDIINKVTIINKQGIHVAKFQENCYTSFYKKYNNTFDWCAFIDIDEFIVLDKWNNINKMCGDSLFKSADIITLTWKTYDDNDMLERDIHIPVMKSFTREVKIPLQMNQKEIVRGHNNKVDKIHAHRTYYLGSYAFNRVTSDGHSNNITLYHIDEYTNNAWVNHYRTKSLKEYLDNKLNMTDVISPDRDCLHTMKYYWAINKKTPEKIEYLKKRGIKYE